MEIIEGVAGQEYLLLGNEGVVRGALEAGVGVTAQYPGTPSSEIGDTFWRIKDSCSVYYQYSVNEKVALETAAAAASSGVRSLTAMKHVGLNVASDSLMSIAYTGVTAGMVIVVADDPFMHSSQNEQDSRIYARLAGLPLLEPATPQDAKDFTVSAFELSQELKMPVLLRLTTRVSHTRGPVLFGALRKGKVKGVFEPDPQRFVLIPGHARIRHEKLLERLQKAQAIAEKSVYNTIVPGNCKTGIIASSVGAAYAREVQERCEDKPHLLNLGFSFPLPEELIIRFARDLDRILIVEELEPLMENEITALLARRGVKSEILGKNDGYLPRLYEYHISMVREAVEKALGCKEKGREKPPALKEGQLNIPVRPPVLCPGCAHRHTYYAVGRALRSFTRGKVKPVYSSDIGCYSLGCGPPFFAADYLLSMGASIGAAGGFAQATEQPVVAFIGDSTFFHGGMTGLINAVHHQHNVTLIIMDNSTTAMTGHQPHPGISLPGNYKTVAVEEVVRGMGVDYLEVIDPGHLKKAQEVVKKALEFAGPAVVIARSPCILMLNRQKKKEGTPINVCRIQEEECTQCYVCLKNFACPAFYRVGESVHIDSGLCNGCGVCIQVCPAGAIEEVD